MKKPMIQFEHFGFKYRSQAEPTLKDINLTIYEGEKSSSQARLDREKAH